MSAHTSDNDHVMRIKEFAPPFARTLYEQIIDHPWEMVTHCLIKSKKTEWKLDLSPEHLEEFGRVMRPLTGSTLGYIGRASLALDRCVPSDTRSNQLTYRLVPHLVTPVSRGEILPDIMEVVGTCVADIFFHIHPARPVRT